MPKNPAETPFTPAIDLATAMSIYSGHNLHALGTRRGADTSPEYAHEHGYAAGPDEVAEQVTNAGRIRELMDLGSTAMQTEVAPRRPLTITEKNANEKKHIAAHLRRVTKQVEDPDYPRY